MYIQKEYNLYDKTIFVILLYSKKIKIFGTQNYSSLRLLIFPTQYEMFKHI